MRTLAEFAQEPRTLDHMRASLARMGFTGVKTFGGVVPLGLWYPYGLNEKNAIPGRVWHGVLRRYDGGLRVVDAPLGGLAEGFYLGVWEPIR